MKTFVKNIGALMFILGAFAFSSTAFAQVETETQEPVEPQTDPQIEQQGQEWEQGAEEEMQQTEEELGLDDQKQREEINITDLPSAVSESLNSGDYQDMQASRAYKVTDTQSGEVFYEIHFTNAEGTTEKKKFNEQGEEVEKDKKKDYK